MSEKRKHERQLLLSYFDIHESEADLAMGYLANISHGGLMLITKNPIQTGISIPIRIDIPEDVDETKELKLVAKSVRCVKDTEFNYFNVGLQVENLSDSDLEKFQKLMSIYALL